MMELPDNFDIIVVGTGMPECIIAAAAARIGKSVLHLDRNGYYGGNWASFSFDKLLEWIDEMKELQEGDTTQVADEQQMSSFLRDGESLVSCPERSKTIFNVSVKSFIRDAPEPEAEVLQDTSSSAPQTESEVFPETSTSASQIESEVLPGTSSALQTEVEVLPEAVTSTSEVMETDSHETSIQSSSINSESSLNADPGEQNVSPNERLNNDLVSMEPENHGEAIADVLSPPVPQHQEWTLSGFLENRRKFNIDLAPKIMFSRGSLVELLISSNIARYAEFQCITRVLTHFNGHIEQVPCSRADVFSTKNVSVVEKRMLMKFLTFCLKYEEHQAEYAGFEDRPYIEFLKSRKLSANVEHYILHAIAMVDESCSTIQGLKSTQKFLQSIGRYGNSPFICTCYGSAELPQCFCRLCAVFEGLYYLKRKVEGLIFKDNRCHSIITMGQRIDCQWLVMESSYAPLSYIPSNFVECISRGILITDASLLPSERKENTLLQISKSSGVQNPVTVIELNSKNYICPEDLYVVYIFCRSFGDTAERDLETAIDLLFQRNSDICDGVKGATKPNILWSAYFNQADTSTANLNSQVPSGVFLTSSPDLGLDYESAVSEAKNIFEAMFPGEEFLPRAPDPEDILVESHNNPGNEDEVRKIENDYSDSTVGDPTATDAVDNADSSTVTEGTSAVTGIDNDVSIHSGADANISSGDVSVPEDCGDASSEVASTGTGLNDIDTDNRKS